MRHSARPRRARALMTSIGSIGNARNRCMGRILSQAQLRSCAVRAWHG